MDLLPMFGLGVALFSSLWFCAGPMLEASRYLAQGFAAFAVIRLLILNIPVILSFTFPMAMVLSVLNGFGRISGDSEGVAVFAGGIPFARVVAPAAVLGLVASLGGYIINDHLAISANQQIANLKRDAFKQVQSSKPIVLPPFTKDDKLQMTVVIGKVDDAKDGMVRNVIVTQYDSSGAPTVVTYAAKALWKEGVQWVLYDTRINYLGEHAAYVTNQAMTVDFHASPGTLDFLTTDPNTLSFEELRKQAKELRAGGYAGDARKSELAMWRLAALPFASLVFAIIGSPLGLRRQRATKAAGWGLAVLIIFGYYVLYMVTGNMSDGGTIPPVLAAFAPDIIGLTVGGILIARAAT